MAVLAPVRRDVSLKRLSFAFIKLMNIDNDTSLQVAAIPSKWPDDRYFLTIIVKGTFPMSSDGSADLAADQLPIFYADELNDENGSIRFAADIAPFKPRADIALVGCAHAPQQIPVRELDIGMRVGSLTKIIRVFGDRHWERGGLLLNLRSTIPEPFTVMDVIYERAFGGIDQEGQESCLENLAGVGLVGKKRKQATIEGVALPNLEDPENLIKSFKDHPRPMGFGFINSAWKPRTDYLGAYDEDWKETRAPELAKDFQFNFYNAVPLDQQISSYLTGREEVELINLSPHGKVKFQLSPLKPTITLSRVSDTESPAERVKMNLDTVCFIPEDNQFYQVWRGIYQIIDPALSEIDIINVSIA